MTRIKPSRSSGRLAPLVRQVSLRQGSGSSSTPSGIHSASSSDATAQAEPSPAHAAFLDLQRAYHHLMPVDANEQRLPSAEDEARFWARVEAAWTRCSAEANRVRRALAARAPGPDTDLSAVEGALPVFLGTLADRCGELPGGELTS